MKRNSELNINFTSCADCENYKDPHCEDCKNHEYFALGEAENGDDYYLHDGHTRKRWKKSKKGNWSFFPLYDKDYSIKKQLTDMEHKRANWTI